VQNFWNDPCRLWYTEYLSCLSHDCQIQRWILPQTTWTDVSLWRGGAPSYLKEKINFLNALYINLLKPKTNFTYHQFQRLEILCSAHNEFMCFAWISEQTAIITLHSISLLVFITEAECLQRGTDWDFKLDGYSLFLKWLRSSNPCGQIQ
jgi:hypothetical protein